MVDWDSVVDEAKSDIQSCLNAWTSLLKETLGNRLKYAYSKGSSVKQWDSPIDYVPIVSDVDIHVMLDDEKGFFPNSSDKFADAMVLSQMYEERFCELQPTHLHIPRSQVMLISRLLAVIEYVPPRAEDVRMLVGDFSQLPLPSPSRVQEIDLQNLLSLCDYLERLPNSVLDRTGLDLWSIIREMAWRVSPSPVRVLTQTNDDPFEVWSWNRTRIMQELRNIGRDDIANHYSGFYSEGWNLFLSNFSSSEAYRKMTSYGYYLLKGCYMVAKSII